MSRSHRSVRILLAGLFAALGLSAAVALAADPIYLPLVMNSAPTSTPVPTATPAWPAIGLDAGVSGFDRPVYVTQAGDGSDRFYVVEQAGRVIVVDGGQPQPTPFLDIRSKVVCCRERGLLGLAFPPGAGPKDHFYVNYTGNAGGQLVTRISRFAIDPASQKADPNSEQIVLTFTQPDINHNGGHLLFGPDGFLYIGTGDGGGAGDPGNRAQNLNDLRGKMLRIDVEAGAPLTYTVPVSNPFVGQPGVRPEIWAFGLRNPWRYSFDRLTNDLYIADVGQDAWEEIDFQAGNSTGGENYGWRIMEGAHCFNPNPCDSTGLVLPVWEYDHNQGDESITGGYVYRGALVPGLQGIYVYADFITGRLWGLRRVGAGWENQLLLATGRNISSFGEDAAGEIWVVDYAGSVHRIVAGP